MTHNPRLMTRFQPSAFRLLRSAFSLKLLLLSAFSLQPSALHAQATPVRVYLDCQHFRCDEDYFVREITFVDYVRSPQDADVHILVTRQDTGGGGDAYSATFIGQRAFAGARDSLSWFAPQGATDGNARMNIGATLIGALPLQETRLTVIYRYFIKRRLYFLIIK